MGCVKDTPSGLEGLFNFQVHEAEELFRKKKRLMIFSFYFQYAGSKSLPLNYTSMAENFYSQSLSSLSSWGRGLNPDEVISISMNF